ncbi:MAG TPA: HAD hydrolase-like protein [Bacillota bacterium]|nr:HAD hydrolase-like protein [Bacillota bacterium]
MSTLIFDFDGTLADTFFIAVGVFRRLVRRARSRQATDDDEVEILRGMPARHALKRVGVRWWQIPYIVYEGRKAVRDQMDQVKAIKGIKPVIEKLHKDGHRILIVSTNSNKNIDRFLHNNGMEGYFDKVYGGIGLFAKARMLAKIPGELGVSMDECYYIGDEVRDIDAARRAGMRCVSVSWGYNNSVALERAKADPILSDPKELYALFSKPTAARKNT